VTKGLRGPYTVICMDRDIWPPFCPLQLADVLRLALEVSHGIAEGDVRAADHGLIRQEGHMRRMPFALSRRLRTFPRLMPSASAISPSFMPR